MSGWGRLAAIGRLFEPLAKRARAEAEAASQADGLEIVRQWKDERGKVWGSHFRLSDQEDRYAMRDPDGRVRECSHDELMAEQGRRLHETVLRNGYVELPPDESRRATLMFGGRCYWKPPADTERPATAPPLAQERDEGDAATEEASSPPVRRRAKRSASRPEPEAEGSVNYTDADGNLTCEPVEDYRRRRVGMAPLGPITDERHSPPGVPIDFPRR